MDVCSTYSYPSLERPLSKLGVAGVVSSASD